MSIIRTVKSKENPYVIMDKEGLQDETLSRKAKWLLAYLLSMPDSREIYLSDLTNRSSDGEHAVRQWLKELLKAGYVKRWERLRWENGGLGWYEYEVHEKSYLWKSKVGKSYLWKSYLGKSQDSNNTSLVNNDCNNNDSINTIDNSNINIPPQKEKRKNQQKEKKPEDEKGDDLAQCENIDPAVEYFMKRQYDTMPWVKYQADTQWRSPYLQTQQSERSLLMKEWKRRDVTREIFVSILDRVLDNNFRSWQIWSIAKLRKKDKDKIPYRIRMLQNIKMNDKPVVDLSSYK